MKNSRFKLTAVLIIATLLMPWMARAHGDEIEGESVLSVLGVIPGSSAEAGGIEAGDRILSIGGTEVRSMVELERATSTYRPGDEVQVVVERGKEIVELPLTLGERDGRVSLGVSLAVMTPEGAVEFARAQADGFDQNECLSWIDETYRLQEVADTLDYDIGDAAATVRTCIEGDLERMPVRIPVRWCDNVFKVHCSGLDLLTEIGEAQVEWCAQELQESLGIDPDTTTEWTSCAEDKIFEKYSIDGQSTDAAGCRAALEECGYRSDTTTESSWLQWGGPGRDFIAPALRLAPSWPEDGPTRLWQRPIGDGYSAILAEQDRLYTMYREGDFESVVSLAAPTGATIWEHRYKSVYVGMRGYGTGPRSTPLIVGDRIFTIGAAGTMFALDKHSGEVLWRRDLWGPELDGNRLGHGYSSSPVAYEDSIIVPVGGSGASLVAFEQDSGEVRWKAHDFRTSYSSPTILEIAGEPQLVAFMAEAVIGVDPATGELLWQHPHTNQWGTNIVLPSLIDKETLMISSPQTGARGLRLTRDGDSIAVEQIWATRRVQFYHSSTVRQGDWIYGSSGTTTPAFMMAINGRTGEIGWKKRGFAKAVCVGADDRLVILDEDGMLYLATATPEDLIVHSETQLLERVAWTAPTIVGSTMFVRDRTQILAVDLG